MGHTLVQSATQVTIDASASLTFDITFAATPTVGNAAIVVASIFVGNSTWTLTGVTDNQSGNAYTTRSAAATVGTTKTRVMIAHAVNIAASGTFTATITIAGGTGSTYLTIGMMEYSGLAISAAEDLNLSNDDIDTSGAVDANVGPTATTTQADALAIGATALNSSDSALTWVSPAGYTNRYRESNASLHQSIDVATKDLTAIGTETLQWSHDNNASDKAGAVLVILKDKSLFSIMGRMLLVNP